MESFPAAVRTSIAPHSGVLRRILFVDDEEIIRIGFARTLNARGFFVDLAANIEEAIDLFRRIHHPIVVTDLAIPGSSGVCVIREIARENSDVLFVIVTGMGSPQLPVDGEFGERIVSVVAKPWDTDQLISTMQRSVRQWHRRTSPAPARAHRRKRVLLIEYNDVDACLVESALPSNEWELTRAASLRSAVEKVRAASYDVVLTDMTLPDARGIDPIVRIRTYTSETPIVVMSGMEDDTIALEAVQAGAQDFLVKGRVDGACLARSLRHASERKLQELRLRKLANEDALTGLANRLRLQERLTEAIVRSQRSAQTIGVIYLDLDSFKAVNDLLGHDAGDDLLIEVARRIRSELQENDFPARIGGDEFAIVFEDLESSDGPAILAERLRLALSRPYGPHPSQSSIRASIGVALCNGGATSAEAIIKAADVAMYTAKRRGGDRYEVCSCSMRPPKHTSSALAQAPCVRPAVPRISATGEPLQNPANRHRVSARTGSREFDPKRPKTEWLTRHDD